MKVNADFSERVAVKFNENEWIPSPMAGVNRKMLDRIGDEVARATTIVRFDPGSEFSPHTHDGGEEYLVLDGVFQDEEGDFGTGSYVRNPPTSKHTPAAMAGATILVKLHQFDPDDRTAVTIDTKTEMPVDHEGVGVVPLFVDAHEDVRIEIWAAGAEINLDVIGGAEVFVLEGGFSQEDEAFEKWDWLRLPNGTQTTCIAGVDGARVWIKTGHLGAM